MDEKRKEIKIVFTDLDGTLLDDNKEISAFSKDVLLKLREKQIPLILSTARIYQTAERFYEALQCSGIVYCSGAVVKYGDRAIQENRMEDEAACEMIRGIFAAEPEARVSVMTTGKMYTNFYDEKTVRVKEFRRKECTGCIRVIFYRLSEEAERWLSDTWGRCFLIRRLEGKNVMACSLNATKRNGMDVILRHLGLQPEQAVMFGDDWNDLECMQRAGYGVAAANAREEIRRQVRYHCGSNNEDGVAKWVKQYLL